MSPCVAQLASDGLSGVVLRCGEMGGSRVSSGWNEVRMCCLYWMRVP